MLRAGERRDTMAASRQRMPAMWLTLRARHPRVGLLDGANDLLGGETTLLHIRPRG